MSFNYRIMEGHESSLETEEAPTRLVCFSTPFPGVLSLFEFALVSLWHSIEIPENLRIPLRYYYFNIMKLDRNRKSRLCNVVFIIYRKKMVMNLFIIYRKKMVNNK